MWGESVTNILRSNDDTRIKGKGHSTPPEKDLEPANESLPSTSKPSALCTNNNNTTRRIEERPMPAMNTKDPELKRENLLFTPKLSDLCSNDETTRIEGRSTPTMVTKDLEPKIECLPSTPTPREHEGGKKDATSLVSEIEAILLPCCQQTDNNKVAVACNVLLNLHLSGTDEDMATVELILHLYVKLTDLNMRPTIASTIIKRLSGSST
jgi:hypothetical protein